MVDPRRTFGPVVLGAGVSGGVLAMAATQPWFLPEGDQASGCESPCVGPAYGDVGSAVWPFALVMLACLGVVLVSRGWFRRVVCALGLLASAAGVAAVVEAYLTGPDEVRDLAQQVGLTTTEVSTTAWFWVAAGAALLSLATWLAAVVLVRRWPEMGRRYDTPASDAPEDLWTALDQGRDPTS